MLGKPVIRGTRLTVELLLRKLSEGATPVDLLTMYPQLEADDVQAALAYKSYPLGYIDYKGLQDELFGTVGTPERNQHELELQAELLLEREKQSAKRNKRTPFALRLRTGK